MSKFMNWGLGILIVLAVVTIVMLHRANKGCSCQDGEKAKDSAVSENSGAAKLNFGRL